MYECKTLELKDLSYEAEKNADELKINIINLNFDTIMIVFSCEYEDENYIFKDFNFKID